MTVAPYLAGQTDTIVTPEDRARGVRLVEDLYDMLLSQQTMCSVADTWCSPDHFQHLKQPAGSTAEADALRRKAPTPWLGLIEDNLSQTLFVEGYRGEGDTDNARIWDEVWQQNRLDRLQIPLHRAAVRYGQAFSYTTSGIDPRTKKDRAKILGFSPKRMIAGFDDLADDEYPFAAGYVTKRYTRKGQVLFLNLVDDHYDSQHVHDGSGWQFVKRVPHGAVDLCPVVRFVNRADLEGNATGEILPFVPLAGRIDQTTFDRLIVQRYGAWRVRWATGLAKPADPEEAAKASAQMRMQDLLVNSAPEGKFGTLDPTDLKGYIEAREADIRDLAAVTQTPPQALLGSLSNLSADALAAAEAALMRKVAERKHSLGESWEQTLRTAAHIMSMNDAAGDYSSQVKWADIESRSLAQVADALGKLATMLEIPWQVLVPRIPGWTQQDTKDTLRLKDAADQAQLEIELALAEAAGAAAEQPPAGGDPKATPAAQASKRPAA